MADLRTTLRLVRDGGISEHTVKTHVASILAKTGCRDRTQVVVLAFDTGLAG